MDSQRPDLMRECHYAGVRFLLAEIDTGLTLVSIAATSPLAHNRERYVRNAEEIYKIVLRLLPRVEPAPGDGLELKEKVEVLRRRLLAAGCSLDSLASAPSLLSDGIATAGRATVRAPR